MKIFLAVLVALVLFMLAQDATSNRGVAPNAVVAEPQAVPTHADSVEAWRLKMLSGEWVDQGNGTTCRLFNNDLECVPLVRAAQ